MEGSLAMTFSNCDQRASTEENSLPTCLGKEGVSGGWGGFGGIEERGLKERGEGVTYSNYTL